MKKANIKNIITLWKYWILELSLVDPEASSQSSQTSKMKHFAKTGKSH